MELVALGRSQFLLGFALAGVNTVLANKGNVLEKMQECKEAGIVILDAAILIDVPTYEREQLEASAQPVVITLAKDDAERASRLRKAIKNTLGVDLLK